MSKPPDAPGHLLEAMVSGEWLRIGELCEPDARLRAALPKLTCSGFVLNQPSRR